MTTTSPHRHHSNRRYPQGLALIILALMLWSSINPAMIDVWIAEMIPVIIIYLLLVFTYKRFQFSNLAYTLMAGWLIMHSIGAHYTFAEVPFAWFAQLTGLEDRNHFDRIAHFMVGFYAYPTAELLLRHNLASFKTALLFGLFMIMSVAAGYEIIEWWFAQYYGGDAGIEFLGSQGDPWDAQKDMLMDTLGAVSSLILYYFIRPDRKAAS
jgi:putative membrane protein